MPWLPCQAYTGLGPRLSTVGLGLVGFREAPWLQEVSGAGNSAFRCGLGLRAWDIGRISWATRPPRLEPVGPLKSYRPPKKNMMMSSMSHIILRDTLHARVMFPFVLVHGSKTRFTHAVSLWSHLEPGFSSNRRRDRYTRTWHYTLKGL